MSKKDKNTFTLSSMENAKLLFDKLENIVSGGNHFFLDSLKLHFGKNGLNIQEVDQSRSVQLQLTFPSNYFDKQISKEITVSVIPNIFHEGIKAAVKMIQASEQQIKINIYPDRLTFSGADDNNFFSIAIEGHTSPNDLKKHVVPICADEIDQEDLKLILSLIDIFTISSSSHYQPVIINYFNNRISISSSTQPVTRQTQRYIKCRPISNENCKTTISEAGFRFLGAMSENSDNIEIGMIDNGLIRFTINFKSGAFSEIFIAPYIGEN